VGGKGSEDKKMRGRSISSSRWLPTRLPSTQAIGLATRGKAHNHAPAQRLANLSFFNRQQVYSRSFAPTVQQSMKSILAMQSLNEKDAHHLAEK
jgi:hypothetical protein